MLKSFKPSKPKDAPNPFGKSYSDALGAGLKLHSPQVVGGWLGW